MSRVIAAIDADPLCYSIGAFTNDHPFVKDADGKPIQMPVSTDVIAGFVDECLEGVIKTVKADEAIFCLSSSVSTNFRDQVAVTYPYKGKREGSTRPFHHKTVVDYLLSLPEVKVANNREADDDLADIALANPDEVVVCTIDKDLDGIHDPSIQDDLSFYNWKRGTQYTLTYEQRYRFFCYQLLVGDWSTDCILGCAILADKIYGPKAQKAGQAYQKREGIGPQKAEGILDAVTLPYWMDQVRLAYQQQFGDAWEAKLNEMGQLLFMGGSEDKLWKHEGFWND